LQHGDVPNEIARMRNCEFLLDVVSLLKYSYLAAQHNRQTDIALPGFVNDIASFNDAALSQRLEQRKLMIV
jgi:hypothetical protein